MSSEVYRKITGSGSNDGNQVQKKGEEMYFSAGMMTLVFATNNPHKLAEAREILGNTVKLTSLEETGFSGELPETHETLEENSEEKAWAAWQVLHRPCIAEDTGLEVDALAGRPGVYSARYAGPGKTPGDNVKLLLRQMETIENRKARFRTVITLVVNGKIHKFEGKVEGRISHQPAGIGGFGYDPVFIPEGYRETFAELPGAVKSRISHRSRALQKLCRFLVESKI